MSSRILTTDRLVMRPPTRDDFEDSAACWGNAEVVRFIGGRVFTREECWSRLLRYVGHWALQGYGFWTVRERETGVYAGEVGLADFRRDMTPSFDGAMEMGWVLVPRAQGKGYATEAVRAALAWSETNFRGIRLVCMIDPGNVASLKVAGKCGFRQFAQTSYKESDVLLFER